MHPNAALIHRFYDSFSALDAAGMAACYPPEVVGSELPETGADGDATRQQ